ncbi:MAG: hypothetical protein WA977_08285 [Halobacteriota archaeon]
MPIGNISLVNQTNATANNTTNVTVVHTIDFEPLISFVSQYKWGILLVAIGIVLLIRIDLVASLIAVMQLKMDKSRKEKKEDHTDLGEGSFSEKDFNDKDDIIDVEYNVIEDGGETANRKRGEKD